MKNRCPICGSPDVAVETPKKYQYDNCGLPNVLLIGNGVIVFDCHSCKSTATTIVNEQQLIQVLGLRLVTAPLGIKGYEMKFLRALYGMTQTEMAKEFPRRRRETISEWEAKGRIFQNPNDEVLPRLVLLRLFSDRVIESDHSFLSINHTKKYLEFTRSIVDNIPEMIEEKRAKSPLSACHQSHKRAWTLDCTPALA